MQILVERFLPGLLATGAVVAAALVLTRPPSTGPTLGADVTIERGRKSEPPPAAVSVPAWQKDPSVMDSSWRRWPSLTDF